MSCRWCRVSGVSTLNVLHSKRGEAGAESDGGQTLEINGAQTLAHEV